jgi:hypothetical protein
MGDLTTVSAVKRQLGIGISTLNIADDDLLGLYVTQASQMIETECARTFSETIGTLYFDARYPVIEGRTLYFDQDMLGVDAVFNGANGTLNPSDYRLLPVHASPKYALQLLPKSNLSWQVGNDGYVQNAIGVIGTSGYCLSSARPADITLAATKLAAWLYQNRDNDGSTVQIANGTTVIPAEAPVFVLRVIEKYIRRVAYSEASHA